ncbi:hypothetical protein FA95DRAFT_1205817 [Auriscalpium vulgare]|uniref:Uncharacterized protein n=1 Tax=Auriscalpium vulgare TaxID=40419 RepID=A0ACB8RU60_9AGAM|nr:hypothetical protein FA95DRAFT_1205817 [Auriscalpium vulgare]
MSSSTNKRTDADKRQQYGSTRPSGGHGHKSSAIMLPSNPPISLASATKASDRAAFPVPPPYPHHPASESALPQYPSPPQTHQATQVHRAATVAVAGKYHQAPASAGTYVQQQRYHGPMTVPSGQQAALNVAYSHSQKLSERSGNAGVQRSGRVQTAAGGPKRTGTSSSSSQHAPSSCCKSTLR